MKIAITGSHGFLGSSLIDELVKQCHEVIRISRSPKNESEIGFDIEKQEMDSHKLDDAKIDVLIHLAGAGIGEKKWSNEQKNEILDSRVFGTKLIAQTLSGLKNKPKLFISASAIGIYGNRGEELLTEDSKPGEDFLSSVCIAWEKETKVAKDAGINTAILRTGIVLGKNGGTLKRMLLPFKIGAGGRLGSGKQMMSWITQNDWTNAVIYICEKQLAGTYNLVAPCAVTNEQFTKSLGATLHRPTILPTPLLPLKIIYGSELVEALLLGSQNVVPKALLEAGYKFESEDIDSALKTVLD